VTPLRLFLVDINKEEEEEQHLNSYFTLVKSFLVELLVVPYIVIPYVELLQITLIIKHLYINLQLGYPPN
jgi:hypothetical protein